jgi:polar amino acid transport system substrate-binding protein
MNNLRLLPILFMMLLIAQTTFAEPLKVGVAGAAPFVVESGDIIDGISVQVWEAIADLEKIEYELVRYDSVNQALADVKHGKLDIAIGPLSITSKRAEEVEFTQPYFRSDLGILTHSVEKSVFARARPFLSKAFLFGLVFLLTLLTLVGALVWLAERKANSDEFPEGARGLVNGMWFAIVTMTTVGYGDKCPKSLSGRIVTAAWMLIATISYSTLTAGIATALTLSSLDTAAIVNPEDMRGERVGVISGTTGAAAARHFGATDIGCKDLEEAAQRLLDGTVKAVVFDMPALRYYIQKNPDDKYILAKATFEAQSYGFALQVDSVHVHEVNVALLALHENQQIHEIAERWMSGGGG